MARSSRIGGLARLVGAGGAAILAAGVLPAAPALTAAAAAGAPRTTTSRVSYLGSADMPAGSTGSTGAAAPGRPGQETGPNTSRDISHPASAPKVALGSPPAATVTSGGQTRGFDALNHFQQRNAGTGPYAGTQFSLEPPDQGLCVGNGYVLEPVNTALTVFDTGGRNLTGAVAINQFFGLAPEINRTTNVRGAFTSDPKCYYDAATRRWFLTILEMGQSTTTPSGFKGPSHTYIAVSDTANPTGRWDFFSIDTTDDGSNGTPVHPGCPCFGDQPLIGADANGFYISTNEFPINSPGFNGAQVYAISKQGLERNPTGQTVVHIDAGTIPAPGGGLWYSIQPATAPPGARNARSTEYFLSALDFAGAGDNRIAAWRLTGTETLRRPTPSVTLSETVLTTTTNYFAPPPNPATGQPTFGAVQKAGTDRPLGNSLRQPEEQLNANDDRMNQVVFDGSHLWGGVNTLLKPGTVGIAFWQVDPATPAVTNQGYVSAGIQNVLYPSIGANAGGQAVMAFTLSGPGYFPSAAFAVWNPDSRAFGDVHVSGAGTKPEDGFTGYVQYGGNGIARWGDYSAAVSDESGNIWTGNEYIPNDPRTSLANWGTFLAEISPGSMPRSGGGNGNSNG